MSADKVTIKTILKKSNEMSRWCFHRVGQYLDELNLGQYKQVSENSMTLITLTFYTCFNNI